MRKLNLILVAMIGILLIIPSCKKSDLPTNNQTNLNEQLAKNDVTDQLAYRTGSSSIISKNLTDGNFSAIARSVTTSGQNMYIGGVEVNSNVKEVAKIWDERGRVTILSDGFSDAAILSVYAYNNDVYAAGYEESGIGGKPIAKVWKNKIAINLTNGSNDALANGVYVSNNDVYVAGYEVSGIGGTSIAKVWKNGVAQNLTDGSMNARALSVFVNNSDVYVAGYENDGSIDVAKVWKNGAATSITDGSIARSVYVSNNNVYVAGNYRDVAKVWKNGIALNLTDGSVFSYAGSVNVSGDDIYVAGYEAAGSGFIAKVWKNGIVTNLTDGFTPATAGAFAGTLNSNGVYIAVGGEINSSSILVAKQWQIRRF